MNDNLKKMYDDFFGNNIIDTTGSIEKEEIESEKIDIESILIDNDSKELLRKIILYMEKYNKKEESNYISFNILLSTDNKETIDKVLSLLKEKSSNYVINDKVGNISLFNKENDLDEIYNNGIINITDLKAFEMKDVENKSLLIHNLKNNLNKKSITIISDSLYNINTFLTYDNDLKNNYFIFKLNGIEPTIQDVYNEVLEKVNIKEDESIVLLDYIKDTYSKRSENYTIYRDKLINYISFNGCIPKISNIKTNEEIFEELDSLVGLEDVKKSLKDLVNLITLKQKTENTLKIKDINLHMVFLGPPGTGKTTVARLLSGILYNLGYIKENKLIEVSSKDLVAEYVGQTAPKTNAVIERSKGGILFIDEAYALASDNNSYNDEAVATLIKGMEDLRDELVVILAGYTYEMDKFLNSNSGIVSRIGYTLNFKAYSKDELIEIFKQMISKAGFKINDDAIKKAEEYIEENMNTKNFGNARFVRNMYEKTIVKHATNTKDKKKKDILITITKEDINIDNLIKE